MTSAAVKCLTYALPCAEYQRGCAIASLTATLILGYSIGKNIGRFAVVHSFPKAKVSDTLHHLSILLIKYVSVWNIKMNIHHFKTAFLNFIEKFYNFLALAKSTPWRRIWAFY